MIGVSPSPSLPRLISIYDQQKNWSFFEETGSIRIAPGLIGSWCIAYRPGQNEDVNLNGTFQLREPSEQLPWSPRCEIHAALVYCSDCDRGQKMKPSLQSWRRTMRRRRRRPQGYTPTLRPTTHTHTHTCVHTHSHTQRNCNLIECRDNGIRSSLKVSNASVFQTEVCGTPRVPHLEGLRKHIVMFYSFFTQFCFKKPLQVVLMVSRLQRYHLSFQIWNSQTRCRY